MTWSISEFVFSVSLSAIAYTFVGYPFVLFVAAALKQTWRDTAFLLRREGRRSDDRDATLPHVALLVTAYNEEAVIEAKLRNTAALDYPADRFEFLLGLDAPTDSTANLAHNFGHPNFRIHQFKERRGKLAVLADLRQRTSAEILAFSDANTLLDPLVLRKLVRHFADSSVGAVSGEVDLVCQEGGPAMETLYWRYEVILKFLESRMNCLLGAVGGVFAVRRELYHPPQSAIVEDFQVPAEIRFGGHRLVYDPEACATEEVAPTMLDEFRRRVRIGTGDFQTLFSRPRFLNPLNGLPAFAYFSHKVLRWLTPIFLFSLFLTNVLMVSNPASAIFLLLQVIFYALATAGWWRTRSGRRAGLAGAPYYFVSMNVALLLGMIRFLRKRPETAWESTPRRLAPEALTKKQALR